MFHARFPQLNHWHAVLDHRGHWTLPDRINDAAAAAERIKAAMDEDAFDAAAERTALLGQVADAARTGGKMPTPADFAKFAARVDGHQRWCRALTVQMSDAVDRLDSAIEASRSLIIAQHLRPALHDVLNQAGAAAEAAEGTGERESLLEGSAASLIAWQTLDRLAERYTRLRDAQARLTHGLLEVDCVPELFGEFRHGRRSVQPGFATNVEDPPPWPASPAGRLRWIVLNFQTHPVWMPTPAERDAAWRQTYSEQAAAASARALATR